MLERAGRDLVLGEPDAYAAFGVAKPVALIGLANRLGREDGFLRYKVGDIDVTVLSDGTFKVPLVDGWIKNVTLNQAKSALRSADLADGYIPIPFTVVAAKIGERLILIDAGTGGAPIYGPLAGRLAQSMEAAGLDPRAVTAILVSHLHGDHILGLMDRDSGAPLFPNAEIMIPSAEMTWWTQPGAEMRQLGPTREGLVSCIRATLATWENVRLIDPDTEVLPGVYTIEASGHSPGQTIHLLHSGRQALLVTADVSLLPAIFARNPGWHAQVDQDPVLASSTRRKIFDRVIADKMLVCGSHWFLPNVGTIEQDGRGYAFVPLTI